MHADHVAGKLPATTQTHEKQEQTANSVVLNHQKQTSHAQLCCVAFTVSSYMQAQLDALVTVFGVQQITTEAALPIWTALLAQCGVLNDGQQE